MKRIFEIVILPFELIFIIIMFGIKNICRWILKDELKHDSDNRKLLENLNREKSIKIEALFGKLKTEAKTIEWLKKIVYDHPEEYTREIKVNPITKEICILEYWTKDPFNGVIKLYGEHSQSENHDALIDSQIFNNTLKLHYIGVKKEIQGQGYGTILLTYYINLAKKTGVKNIIGELTSIKEFNVEKLKEFYPRFGFEVIMLSQPIGDKVADIELKLK